MIIAYDTPGQLGNQLWAYTNLIAIAREYKVAVYIILNDNYYTLLDEATLIAATHDKVYILSDSHVKAKIIKRAVAFFTATNKKVLRKIITAFLPVSVIHSFTEKSLPTMQRKWHCSLVNAWELRLYKKSLLKQRKYIRDLIVPEKVTKEIATQKIATLKSSFNLVVAVHIRRGDYKFFQEGKHYFEDEFYYKNMQQLAALLAPAKVCFVIFSNEKINLNHFEGLPVFSDNDATPIGDMWAISKCDYIIGPLSTFSMWASFWNEVPLQFISKESEVTSLSNFSAFIAQDVKENDIDDL